MFTLLVQCKFSLSLSYFFFNPIVGTFLPLITCYFTFFNSSFNIHINIIIVQRSWRTSRLNSTTTPNISLPLLCWFIRKWNSDFNTTTYIKVDWLVISSDKIYIIELLQYFEIPKHLHKINLTELAIFLFLSLTRSK